MESGGSGSGFVRGAAREKKKGKSADESSVAAVAGEPGGGGGGGNPRKFVSSLEREGGHLPCCRGIWGSPRAELPPYLPFLWFPALVEPARPCIWVQALPHQFLDGARQEVSFPHGSVQ